MPFDYDSLYRQTPDALGAPTPAIVGIFEQLAPPLQVLDVGCGQGRDALFIARLGHRVTGIDISQHGITQLNATAARENLPITAVVADIRTYQPDQGKFDVLLIDRTLHMLEESPRSAALTSLLSATKPGSLLVIADERRNMPEFLKLLAARPESWTIDQQSKGYLIATRD